MLKRIAVFNCILVATLTAQAQPRQVPEYSIEQFLDTVNYSGASFSPNGSKLLVNNNKTGIYNAYAFPVDGSEPTALTESETETVIGVSYFPDDERVLYTSDQGANDPRVLQVESDEMVAGVRANGVPVEYVIFDDEGHGFRKKENQITGYKAILAFLEEHL